MYKPEADGTEGSCPSRALPSRRMDSGSSCSARNGRSTSQPPKCSTSFCRLMLHCRCMSAHDRQMLTQHIWRLDSQVWLSRTSQVDICMCGSRTCRQTDVRHSLSGCCRMAENSPALGKRSTQMQSQGQGQGQYRRRIEHKAHCYGPACACSHDHLLAMYRHRGLPDLINMTESNLHSPEVAVFMKDSKGDNLQGTQTAFGLRCPSPDDA